mgnify:CR=1 FL=1
MQPGPNLDLQCQHLIHVLQSSSETLNIITIVGMVIQVGSLMLIWHGKTYIPLEKS